MSDQKIQVQIGQATRGSDAANFWTGVAIVVGAVYLWWNGYFSLFALETGLSNPPGEDGLQGAGDLVGMSIDTLCLIGSIGIAVIKFGRSAIGEILRRFNVKGAIADWGNAPQLEQKKLEALQSHERRLRDIEADVLVLQAKTGDLPDPPPPKTVAEQLVDALAELERLKTAEVESE